MVTMDNPALDLQDGYYLRTADYEDWNDVDELLNAAFNEDPDEEVSEVERIVFEPHRTVLAMREREVAGVSASFTRDLTVPGGVLSAAHVTMVSVAATHRRRGLLTAMIRQLHTEAIELGEPLAVLWASEGRIYQRYGYGLASRYVVIEAKTNEVTLRDPAEPDDGEVVSIAPDSYDEFAEVYDRVLPDRPGWSSRDERWWRYRVADPKSRRNGGSPRRAVVYQGPNGIDGYLTWRVKNEWSRAGADGVAHVGELIAATPAAYRALYQFALSLDLTRTLRVADAAIDEPLQYLVSDPRRLEMHIGDSLWVRLLDVPVALAGRRYGAPIDVVFEITDPAIPANDGRFRLVGDRNTATCTTTDEPADVWVDMPALGAAYLGGISLTALADGGRVRELRAGTLGPASIAFGWDRAPSTVEVF